MSILSRIALCRSFSIKPRTKFMYVSRVQIVTKDVEFTLPGETSELYLKLNADYTIEVLNQPMGKATGEKGRWTMVYD